MSPETEPVVAPTDSGLDLNARPVEPAAWQYLKRTGLLRHIRWGALVTLAEAANRQLTLAEVEETIALRSGSLSCGNCGKQFEEPVVLTVKNTGDPNAVIVPPLTPEMSAHVGRTKAGNIRFQGATFIIPNEKGEEEPRSFCGPLYFNRVREDGTVSQVWDARSCLGIAMKAAAEAAKEKAPEGTKPFVPAPLTSNHAEEILRAKAAARDRRTARRANIEASVTVTRENMKNLFRGRARVSGGSNR